MLGAPAIGIFCGAMTIPPESAPDCCGSAAQFFMAAGVAEIRSGPPGLEGQVMSYLVYEMGLVGPAAARLFASLDRERGPVMQVFRCARCETLLFQLQAGRVSG